MNKFLDLYGFIDLAKNNRKYPENTANGLKSALKIFEKDLNIDELNSVNLVEDNIEEIFINVVAKNKNKNIGSMNTYKARLLKVIKDYQKYGMNPAKMQGWITRQRKITPAKFVRKDNSDKITDNMQTALSDLTNTPVHKIELSLRDNVKSMVVVPKDITAKEIKIFKDILDSLSVE